MKKSTEEHNKRLLKLTTLLSEKANWDSSKELTLSSAKSTPKMSPTFSEVKDKIKITLAHDKSCSDRIIGLCTLTALSIGIIIGLHLSTIDVNFQVAFISLFSFVLAASAIGAAFLSYKTFNKTQLKTIKNIKATQKNMTNFFKERNLNEEDYKDKPVLQTIRDNPIDASV